VSSISKPVYQSWGGTLRFGNVAEEKTEKGWKFYKVDWVDDELHERAIASMLSLRRGTYDANHEWHRTDHVNFFEPDEMISTINKLEVE